MLAALRYSSSVLVLVIVGKNEWHYNSNYTEHRLRFYRYTGFHQVFQTFHSSHRHGLTIYFKYQKYFKCGSNWNVSCNRMLRHLNELMFYKTPGTQRSYFAFQISMILCCAAYFAECSRRERCLGGRCFSRWGGNLYRKVLQWAWSGWIGGTGG